jgi:penicillin-binding protein 1A
MLAQRRSSFMMRNNDTMQLVARSVQRERRLRRFSVLRLAFLLLLYLVSLAAAGMYFAVVTVNRDLPDDLTALVDYQPSRKSTVYSADGETVGEFTFENRKLGTLDRMPPHVPGAFLSAEDRRFYQHGGFDLVGIVRAAINNLRSDKKQGGSTLTQQIIKQTLLASEENIDTEGLTPSEIAKAKKRAKYQRKLKELILAVRVERELKKTEILAIYLNHVYLGNGAYGVAAAAEAYFGKDVQNLTIAEAALLAGLVASPTSMHRPPT